MDIIIALAGIALLIKGRVKVTGTSEVSPAVGRILGAIILSPFVFFFFLGYSQMPSPFPGDTDTYFEYGVPVIALLSAIIFFRRPIQPVPVEFTPTTAAAQPPQLSPSVPSAGAIPQQTIEPPGQVIPSASVARAGFKPIFIVLAIVLFIAVGGAGYYLLYGSPLGKTVDHAKTTPLVDFNVAEAVPAVVQVECLDENAEIYGRGSGASVYFDDGSHGILTNAHVVRAPGGGVASGCFVYFPWPDGTFYESAYWAGLITPFDDKQAIMNGIEVGGPNFAEGGVDYAFLEITSPAKREDGVESPRFREFPDLFKLVKKTCPQGREIQIGEKLFVLGYPAIGGVSMTITDGVVSGFEGSLSEWIKTSAKIEQGHSGGVAVLAKDGCPIGIPTLSVRGGIESIARVLPYSFIWNFISILSSPPIQ